VIDTRRDPAFPRNAVHATLGIEHLDFAGDASVTRRVGDARAYLGLIGSTVLALRVTTSHVDAPLPLYERRLLGGTSLLRGYRFGYRAGDNLAAMSAEVRVPITSPLNVGRFGFKGFVDYGTVYPHGERLARQTFDRGIGGGVFLTATVIRMGLDVAWPKGDAKKPRWHFGLGVTF
jgi:outer membrane protein assembly factor BamA